MSGFFINTEIALVGVGDFNAAEIFLIRRIEQSQILVQNVVVFFFKDTPVLTEQLVSVLIILAVLCNLVNEKQGKHFDSHIKELFFFLKMRLNRFSDLDSPHILLYHITDNLALANNCAVRESYRAVKRLNVGNGIAVFILLHFAGLVVEVIADGKLKHFPLMTALLCHFDFKLCHRRLVRRKHNVFEIKILACAGKVLYLKALDLNLLDEFLIERIQSVKYIDKVVLLCVRGRVVQAEQRIEVLKSFLRDLTAHFLRFVQNDNRSVRLDNINRAAGTELITLGIDNTSFLALAVLFQRGGKRLRIDNHDINAGAGGEVVQLVQVGAVVDEEASLLAILLHEMVGGNLESLIDALTNCNTRHDHNELAPPVKLVQLKHGLDVDIGFTRTGLHLYVERAASDITDELVRKFNIVFTLNSTDVIKQLLVR